MDPETATTAEEFFASMRTAQSELDVYRTKLVKVCGRCGKRWKGRRPGYYWGERNDGMRIWHEGSTLCCGSGSAQPRTVRIAAEDTP